jgi:hypothetical protein
MDPPMGGREETGICMRIRGSNMGLVRSVGNSSLGNPPDRVFPQRILAQWSFLSSSEEA